MGGQPTPAAAAAIAERAAETQDGVIMVDGERHMRNADGALFPYRLIKPHDLAQDQAVRRLLDKARGVAAILAHFKLLAFDDVDALQALLAERYKVTVGGKKGNITLYRYDGLEKITVQVADLVKFGPELQSAKALIDECAAEWVIGARVELKALVMDAFVARKEGKLDRGKLLGLRRYDIQDPRWVRAMEAISDSMTVIGSKRYIRFGFRADIDGAWEEISLNIATARPPAAA